MSGCRNQVSWLIFPAKGNYQNGNYCLRTGKVAIMVFIKRSERLVRKSSSRLR